MSWEHTLTQTSKSILHFLSFLLNSSCCICYWSSSTCYDIIVHIHVCLTRQNYWIHMSVNICLIKRNENKTWVNIVDNILDCPFMLFGYLQHGICHNWGPSTSTSKYMMFTTQCVPKVLRSWHCNLSFVENSHDLSDYCCIFCEDRFFLHPMGDISSGCIGYLLMGFLVVEDFYSLLCCQWMRLPNEWQVWCHLLCDLIE